MKSYKYLDERWKAMCSNCGHERAYHSMPVEEFNINTNCKYYDHVCSVAYYATLPYTCEKECEKFLSFENVIEEILKEKEEEVL